MEGLNKPIIMTAQMGPDDFAWANALRRRYFPPERNLVPAHITLFHHLPPQALAEIKQVIVDLTRQFPSPAAELSRLIHLGRGVAYQLHAPELLAIREEMAVRFRGLLTPQDQQPPRLHITVQNKVTPHEAKQLLQALEAGFEPRPISIRGLQLHHYLDGPWQEIGSWSFRGR